VPTQDAQGRWISDDGLQYWDGAAWRPLGAQPTRKSSAVPAVLIGCGFVLVVVLVVVIGLTVLAFNSSDFQQAFCNGWANSASGNTACPFHPSSP
jgi:ABC-type uncharacterized transport system permease subunit